MICVQESFLLFTFVITHFRVIVPVLQLFKLCVVV